MSRTEALNRCLKSLQVSVPDVEASAVVSPDGLIIASALPQGVEEGRIAAMTAAMLSMGGRTVRELKRGNMDQLYVKGDDGYAVIMAAGTRAVLLALTRKEAKLGLIFFELSRACDEIKQVLS